MSRPLALFLVVLAALVIGLFALAGRAHEKPTQRIEKAVNIANLSS